jgi:hypothetical protein
VVAIRQGAGTSAFFLKRLLNLNSKGGEKLRKDDWLISTILLEINQLAGCG